MEILGLILETLTSIGIAFVRNLPLLIAGILVFFCFNSLAKSLSGFVKGLAEKSGLELALASILSSLTGIVLRIVGLLVAAVVVIPSFDPASLIAGLGLSSVAIGFAFKDILQNFVAGILILWNKPFSVDDVIETKGHLGTVTMINVRSTYIKTFDGKQVIIPNGDVFGSEVKVFSAYPARRFSVPVGIGYSDSIDQAQEIIMEAVRGVAGVLMDPEPMVYLNGLGGSSVDFEVFVWINQEESSLLKVKHEVIRAIKLALDEAEIDMPYAHHVLQFDRGTVLQADFEKGLQLNAANN